MADFFFQPLGIISDPSPAFGIWIKGAPDELVDLLGQALISAGIATDWPEAMRAINDLIKDHPTGGPIAVCDLFGGRISRQLAQLKSMLRQVREPAATVNWRLFGIKGHKAVPALLLQPAEKLAKVDLVLLEKMKRFCLKNLQNENFAFFGAKIGLFDNFFALMKQIFGRYAADLISLNETTEEIYFLLTTMLSWATAVIARGRTRPLIFFPEVRILGRQHDISGGFVDAVEVVKINGKRPNKLQRDILRNMAQTRFGSTAGLMRELERVFAKGHKPPQLDLRFIDWKFPVGDGIPTAWGEKPVITLRQVKEDPLPAHVFQMKRYLALASFGKHLEENNEPRLWAEMATFTRGSLVYFMPQKIVRHEISMSSEGLEDFLQEHVAGKISSAGTKATWRLLNNKILGFVLGVLSGKNENSNYRGRDTKSFLSVSRIDHPQQPRLFPIRELASTISILEEMSRNQFLDPSEVIWKVGVDRRGRPKYAMDYGRLLKAISSGAVSAGRRFRPERGGFVHCLDPEHPDIETPSMRITPERGIFFCFGCGLKGRIDKQSLPKELSIPIVAGSFRQHHAQKARFDRMDPKPEHLLIMKTAQTFLQDVFWGSEGEKYLVGRDIDPHLAYSLGMGFGTDHLVNGLLDAGWTLDQLIFYGFVAVSSQVSSQRGIVPLLSRRGMKWQEIRRETGHKSKEGKPLYGLPYAVLNSRLTAPLGIGGKIDNFYGRYVLPTANKQFNHRKLSAAKTNVLHGGFNFQALENPDVSTICVIEGALDVISFLQMDLGCPAVGIIGVTNIHLLEVIARAKVESVGLGLDWDDSGKKAALKAIIRLKEEGVKSVFNFTQLFVDDNFSPGCEVSFKDWNELLRLGWNQEGNIF